MTTPSPDDLLESYLKKALERIDRGETVHPTELCREHPDLAPAVAEALGLADELSVLQSEALEQDPLAGKVLGERYRLDACLGRGAMGVVYQATDQELQRQVAVKILDARLFRDPTSEQRFLREAEMLAAMQHPHVVAIHDRGRTGEGILYLVMEQLHGCSMSALLGRIGDGQDPIEQMRELLGEDSPETGWIRTCARWTADLAAGLAAVHDRGITHRDLKPSNVFLRRDHKPVLLDFGIAARAEDMDARLTATASTLGTPSYMAPEQVGGGAAGPQVDVYGLGSTLYHLLARRPPYSGDPMAVLLALRERDPAPIRSVRPDVPRDLQAIVEKAMERDPRRRYPDARAMERDLRAFLEHLPVSVRPLSWAGRKWRAVQRRPARAVAVAGVAVALISGFVGVSASAAESARELEREKEELLRELPSLLAVEGQPHQRLAESLTGEIETDLARLDRILELAPDDPVRLFRAALRQDLGDHGGAAADYQYLAQEHASVYLNSLFQRYLSADPEKRGTEAVSLEGLPDPVTDHDKYVAAFQELRNRTPGFGMRAEQHLDSMTEMSTAARDLRLLALLAVGQTAPDARQRTAAYRKAHDESLFLKGAYGKDTARTLAVRGAALAGLKRYDEALEPLRQSLELRPDRHGPHQNLGLVLRRLGSLPKAQEHLAKAAALRPDFWNTQYTLAQVYRDLGDFEAARSAAAMVPDDIPPPQDWWKADLLGNIGVAEAMALRDTQTERAIAAAREAVAAFDEALAIAKAAKRDRAVELIQKRREVAVALRHTDVQRTLTAFMEVLLSAPDNPYQVANLAHLLPPTGLDERATWMLGLYLRSLSFSLAKGDPKLQQRMDEEFALLRARDPK